MAAWAPLAFLVLARVRRVVRADDIDDALGQGLAQGQHVLLGAEGRVDLVDGVVAADQLVRQQQVVRGDLGGDPDAALLGPADDLHTARRGDVADVQAGVDVLCQEHVAGDDALLGDRGPAGQAEDRGHLAFVHLGARREARLLSVLGDDAVERLHVFEGAAHQDRVVDADAVVREHPHLGAGVGHGAQLGELLAGQADGHRAHGAHIDPAGGLAEAVDLLDDAGRVGHRGAVRHGVHGGVTAQRRGAGSGLHGLGVLPARLTQVGVNVHETRQGHETRRVGHGGALGVRVGCGVGAESGDDAVGDQDVGGLAAQERGSREEVVVGTHAGIPSVTASVLWSSASRPPARSR
ncbi:hypothetical protein QFZ52_001306 [Arthrobacter woluwensis]|nr:hypothetical protein [Arthrobacter woluwensis]